MPHHHGNRKPAAKQRAFALGVAFNILFVVAEAFFGVISGSLALLADAGHNLSDVLGLLLAWGAGVLSRRSPTRHRTYGWRSSSIMAALLNAIILLLIVGGIAWEAIRRIYLPAPTPGWAVIIVALAGVGVNSATALLFIRDRKHDLNVRGAFLHMAADAGVSLGVAASGILILWTGWLWIDPVISLVVAMNILLSTWGLLRESLDLALHAVPASIDIRQIEAYLAGLPGVDAVHDLHVWAMSTTETALTAHLVKPDPRDDDQLIATIGKVLNDRFAIDHITIQWERNARDARCDTALCER